MASGSPINTDLRGPSPRERRSRISPATPPQVKPAKQTVVQVHVNIEARVHLIILALVPLLGALAH